MAKKRASISLRKPPSPEAVEAFVRGSAPPESGVAPKVDGLIAEVAIAAPPVVDETPLSAVAVIATPAVDAALAVEAPSALLDASGRPLRAVTVYLPVEMAERLTQHCLTLDRDLSRVMVDALEAHLGRQLGPAPDAAPAPTEATPAEAAPAPAATPSGRIERWLELGRAVLAGYRVARAWAF